MLGDDEQGRQRSDNFIQNPRYKDLGSFKVRLSFQRVLGRQTEETETEG